MIPVTFPSKTTPWRVQVPCRFFANKKRTARYFKTKEAAEDFCRSVKKFGLAAIDQRSAPAAELKEYAPLIAFAIAELGNDPAKLFEAIAHFKATRLNVTAATVREAIEKFSAVRKTKIDKKTWNTDRGRLLKFLAAFEHKQISQITEPDLRKFFDGLPGHTRSIYKTMRVFFGWAKDYNLLSVNPMASIKPTEQWGVRNEIYSADTFARMLRISAGLEPCKAGELPTRDFIGLFPWFVLSGFCGLRSCEAFRTNSDSEAIRWSDLYFDRGFLEIRETVAKKTGRKVGDKRHVETGHYLEAAAAWLALAPRASEFIVPFCERKIQDLKTEFEKRTGIQLLENGLRNSFASYALTFNGLAGVGKLAMEMGNSEAICKRFYIRTLQPGTGKAWFNLRPGSKVIPMVEAAAA
jgi:hypothetical protein